MTTTRVADSGPSRTRALTAESRTRQSTRQSRHDTLDRGTDFLKCPDNGQPDIRVVIPEEQHDRRYRLVGFRTCPTQCLHRLLADIRPVALEVFQQPLQGRLGRFELVRPGRFGLACGR
jgi:hypothetical protein